MPSLAEIAIVSADKVSSEYIEAIGKIVTEITVLERCITFSIQSFTTTRIPNEVICLVGGENFEIIREKLDKLSKFVLKDEKSLLQEFEKIIKTLEKLNRARNKYIHSFWWPQSKQTAFRNKFRRTIKLGTALMEYETVPIETLKKLVKDTETTTSDLFSFMIDNISAIKAAKKRRIKEHYLTTARGMLKTSKTKK